ncbi:MAG: serine kinase [Lysobacteraceae bacterium]|nr:MAG: serine kinase [Xanthomonadaceae bacterium]
MIDPHPVVGERAPPPRRAPWLVRHEQIMGGRFCFRSDSQGLLDVVESAYGGHAPHRFPFGCPEFDIELRLLPRRSPQAGAPPPVRTNLDDDLLHGIIDECNHVRVSPGLRRAQVVASADMLDRPYHLRYELIEFAVFLLAARCQQLVPLHAACVGRDGRGILLLGDSGAGKSTLALHSLLQGLDFLSEDAVFVHTEGMLATGVANFLHVRADGLDGIGDAAARRWIAASPVIRRRSGVEKFEADLRRAPGAMRIATAPLQLIATVILSPQGSGRSRALPKPLASADAVALLRAGQAYAMTQPGWNRFECWVMDSPVHLLQRGRHPEDSVEALRELLD